MKSIKFNIVLIVLVVAALLAPQSGFSQKKKRGGDESAGGIRLREAEFYFTEGEKFFILEDYAKALVYYQRALDINPDNGTIHYKMAEVLAKSSKQEDLLKAATSIEQGLKLDRENKYFYLLAATIYNSLGRYDKAAEAYETMMETIKGTDEYLYEVAAVYQYAGLPEEAVKAYNRAEKVFGVNEVSSIQKLKLKLDAGKNAEGLAEGEKLIKAFPDEDRYLMAFTEIISKKGMRDKAIYYLEDFVGRNPESGNVKMLLAGFYRDVGQEQKARPFLLSLFEDPGIELNSKLIVLGAYNAELNDNKSRKVSDPEKEAFAVSLYEKLKEGYPGDPSVHVIGGDLYLVTGKNREAQREYLKAVESGAVDFEVYENLLFLETRLELWDQAIKHSEEALEIFPNQSMIHYFSGFANLRKRHYPEAIGAFEQAKRLSASNPSLTSEINSQLGEAYHATKDYQKSDKAYEDALAFNPNNATVLNNYSYYLALRKENLEKAEKMSSTLIKNHPENPIFLDTYAWVLFTREKYKDAKKIIERAITTGKATATHFEHYGDILFKLGDTDGAVGQWEKARGLNANSETLNKKIANRKIYE
ncbi:MAG TPA: tetratricopeptide repeat protein [Chryseosolibacter sp.]|nr:tetratricopeptide repeat protein [Chryseosolibacter sp.]